MKKTIYIILGAFLLLSQDHGAIAENLLEPPINGIPSPQVNYHAIHGKKVYISPGKSIDNAWILIKGDQIVDVFKSGKKKVPSGYKIWDIAGSHIYPGFIEPYLEVSVTDGDPNRPGSHWNPRVQPSRSAKEASLPSESDRINLRKAGFSIAQVVPSKGIFRGQTAIISLGAIPGDRSQKRAPFIKGESYQSVAFESGSRPNSLMGLISLIRQTLLDAEYNARSGNKYGPNALDSIRVERSHPRGAINGPSKFIMSGQDELDLVRAEKILDEFGITQALLKGTGSEFKRLKALSGKYPVIVPLDFPSKPGIGSVGEQESVNLRQLMDWEHLPKNILYLADHQFPFLLTSSGGVNDFLRLVQEVQETGVDSEILLNALTTLPAQKLGISHLAGSVEVGKKANLTITDKPIFTKGAEVQFSWIDGNVHKFKKDSKPEFKGNWEITGLFEDNQAVILEVQSEKSAKLIIGESEAEVSYFSVSGETLHFVSRHPDFGDEPLIVFTAGIFPDEENNQFHLAGRTVNLDGSGKDWTANKLPSEENNEKELDKKTETNPKFSWVGTWSGEMNNHKGETTTGLLKIVKTAKGKYIGHIKADNAVVPLDDIETDGKTLLAKADIKKNWIQLNININGNGQLNGWSKSNKDSERVSISGTRLSDARESEYEGRWQLTGMQEEDPNLILVLEKHEGLWHGHINHQGVMRPVVYSWNNQGLNLVFDEESNDSKREVGSLELSFNVEKRKVTGSISSGDFKASMRLVSSHQPLKPEMEVDANKGEEKDKPFISPFALPFGPYAYESLPTQKDFWLQNAYIWTSGPQGNIEGDLIVSGGEILFVGTHDKAIEFLKDSQAVWTEFDARGMHVTPGLIDCHSHTGIERGVNEVGQAITAEVNIGTSTNPDDVNWYRQLAGGLTTVNTLHGSANPIGGQNQVNKLRWGVSHPDEMHFKGAMPGIKFALGENVKRKQSRYPNTRMGVESVFRERFQAANEYLARHQKYKDGEIGVAPRRDLELEALSEILLSKRLIHCHSYRQDEILMLCRVAGDFGFRIGTFQHILEGYKVAEIIREHAIGGSAFSDWWAYKVEVQDAIPFAGAIMHKAGMVVSFNSDDSEMARRMNLEAAKAVKYGGLSEIEALKFVTLNPAKQLMIEDQVGSLEVGKNADFAVWNGHPFSTATVCQSTWIDGREYFSVKKDQELRQSIKMERKRLMAKIIGSGKPQQNRSKEPKTSKPDPENLMLGKVNSKFESPAQYWKARVLQKRNLELLERGIDPSQSQCGECGIRNSMLIE